MKFLDDREVFSQIIIQKPEDCVSFNSLWIWPRKNRMNGGGLSSVSGVPSGMRFETFRNPKRKACSAVGVGRDPA